MRNRTELVRCGIDCSREKILPFQEAARVVGKLKGVNRVALQTLHRWATKGARGVVLESLFVGGARCTSMEALQRFFAALTEARRAPMFECTRLPARSSLPVLADSARILAEAGISARMEGEA